MPTLEPSLYFFISIWRRRFFSYPACLRHTVFFLLFFPFFLYFFYFSTTGESLEIYYTPDGSNVRGWGIRKESKKIKNKSRGWEYSWRNPLGCWRIWKGEGEYERWKNKKWKNTRKRKNPGLHAMAEWAWRVLRFEGCWRVNVTLDR